MSACAKLSSPLFVRRRAALLVAAFDTNSLNFAEKPPFAARMTLGRAAYGPREDRAAQGAIHAEP